MRLLADENILGLEAIPPGEATVVTRPGRQIAAEDLLDADALWVRSVTTVDASLLSSASLRFVGTATAGLEHIDRPELARRGISFADAPGANANAVAEYVLAALLELEVPWAALEQGGTLGVVGYGAIGRRLTVVAEALGWNVRVCDPYIDERQCARERVALDAILDCEVISLHPSLSREGPWPSYHLLGDKELGRLQASQTLINASRGPVIDNSALLRRLRAPDPPTVVLDVWEGEPELDTQLLECAALRIATPHIAGYSWHAKWNATQKLWQEMYGLGLVGSPSLTATAGSRPSLNAPASPLGAKELMGLSYVISDDDRRLRAACQQPARARIAAFDQLRKDHPTRYELASEADNFAAWANEEGRRLLSALGRA